MCACEPGFTCSRCAGTWLDDRWVEDDTDTPERDREPVLSEVSDAA